jgi:hypothetical protein
VWFTYVNTLNKFLSRVEVVESLYVCVNSTLMSMRFKTSFSRTLIQRDCNQSSFYDESLFQSQFRHAAEGAGGSLDAPHECTNTFLYAS